MWIYQKKLEYPVNITTPNPRMAKADRTANWPQAAVTLPNASPCRITG